MPLGKLRPEKQRVLSREIKHTWESVWQEVLENTLDSLNLGPRTLRLNELKIRIRWSDTLSESALREQFSEALTKTLHSLGLRPHSSNMDTEWEVSDSERRVQWLRHYLKTGTFPWWQTALSASEIETALSELILTGRSETLRWLERELRSNPSVRKRVFWQFSRKIRKDVLLYWIHAGHFPNAIRSIFDLSKTATIDLLVDPILESETQWMTTLSLDHASPYTGTQLIRIAIGSLKGASTQEAQKQVITCRDHWRAILLDPTIPEIAALRIAFIQVFISHSSILRRSLESKPTGAENNSSDRNEQTPRAIIMRQLRSLPQSADVAPEISELIYELLIVQTEKLDISPQEPGPTENQTTPQPQIFNTANDRDFSPKSAEVSSYAYGPEEENPDAALFDPEFHLEASTRSPERLYVANAGLVLLHPFLERFFGYCEIDLQQDEKDWRAPLLLHGIASGLDETIEAPEGALIMPKLLAGWPMEETLPTKMLLKDSEKEALHNLLPAVIQHWGRLGNTGADTLRSSFLQRPGLLIMDPAGPQLHVESQAHDVLLDTLPWPLSIVRLSWMKQPLCVDWSLK